MVVSAGPDWLGSPQHFIVGALAAVAVFAAARSRRIRLPEWVAFILAVSLISTAELVLELIEYPVLYANHFHHSAYYDTLADMANSLVGAIIGALAAVAFSRRIATRS
jgi:MYXO-CTERM domain-containing protein